MIKPAPTGKLDPTLARGRLVETIEATATKPAHVVLTFPNTSYQMHLVPDGEVTGEVGKRIVGTIRASARRVDECRSGGRYVEPVYGRPRRVQGMVRAIEDDAIVVDAGVPIRCTLTDARQKPGDFEVGDFVTFDVLDGATFAQRAN
jgi:hypothetical protein